MKGVFTERRVMIHLLLTRGRYFIDCNQQQERSSDAVIILIIIIIIIILFKIMKYSRVYRPFVRVKILQNGSHQRLKLRA